MNMHPDAGTFFRLHVDYNGSRFVLPVPNGQLTACIAMSPKNTTIVKIEQVVVSVEKFDQTDCWDLKTGALL